MSTQSNKDISLTLETSGTVSSQIPRENQDSAGYFRLLNDFKLLSDSFDKTYEENARLCAEIESLKADVTRHKLGELMIAESYQREIEKMKEKAKGLEDALGAVIINYEKDGYGFSIFHTCKDALKNYRKEEL